MRPRPHQYKDSAEQAEGSALSVLLDWNGQYISGIFAD